MDEDAPHRHHDSIDGLRRDVQALTQGLSLMLETQGTHTEMLAKLLEAATQPPPEENPLEDLLRHFIAALDRQTDAFGQLDLTIQALPAEMENAVVQGFRSGTGGGTDTPA